MHPRPRVLHNTPEIELWPAHLLRARSNAHARALARASYVLRRKRDGGFIAAHGPDGLVGLVPALAHEPGFDAALRRLRSADRAGRGGTLPLHRLQERLAALGLDDDYGRRSGLVLTPEPTVLRLAGFDRYRRPLWLEAGAARAWAQLHAHALRDGIVLEAVSGYRSHAYQLGIFERKLARGQSVPEILQVNAAPGFSEHHSGRALDLSTPGEPAAEESFERTAAFDWLCRHAAAHDFVMSYPRDNPHGIVYEPWHWCHRPAG